MVICRPITDPPKKKSSLSREIPTVSFGVPVFVAQFPHVFMIQFFSHPGVGQFPHTTYSSQSDQ